LLTGRNARQVATSFFSNSRDCIATDYSIQNMNTSAFMISWGCGPSFFLFFLPYQYHIPMTSEMQIWSTTGIDVLILTPTHSLGLVFTVRTVECNDGIYPFC
jgi:hypothetical protein